MVNLFFFPSKDENQWLPSPKARYLVFIIFNVFTSLISPLLCSQSSLHLFPLMDALLTLLEFFTQSLGYGCFCLATPGAMCPYVHGHISHSYEAAPPCGYPPTLLSL